jgi:hypothetical protein
LGIVTAELNYAVTDNLTVGAGVLSWNLDLNNDKIEAFGFHVRTDYYLEGAYQQGWYLAAELGTLNLTLTQTELNGDVFTGEASASGISLGGGYHWQWDSFFQQLGILYTQYSFDDAITLKDQSGNTQQEDVPGTFGGLGLEWNMGWKF